MSKVILSPVDRIKSVQGMVWSVCCCTKARRVANESRSERGTWFCLINVDLRQKEESRAARCSFPTWAEEKERKKRENIQLHSILPAWAHLFRRRSFLLFVCLDSEKTCLKIFSSYFSFVSRLFWLVNIEVLRLWKLRVAVVGVR